MKYVEIVVFASKNIDKKFIYCYENNNFKDFKIGTRVFVEFGKSNKIYDGMVYKFLEKNQIDFKGNIKKIKYIDEKIYLNFEQISIAEWMSEVYMCSLSSCLRLFMPIKRDKTNKNHINNYTNNFISINNSVNKKISFLTSEQNNAIEFIFDKLEKNDKKNILIHGVTGSGKTEIYFRTIEKVLKNNKKVIFLLPEIALTTHMVDLFFSRFKNQVGVLHSKISLRERYLIWLNIRENKINIILGPRSALFAPVTNLGLVIIDEEHEQSYFQNDSVPRYHAVEVARKICDLTKANLILGSATPSIDTYHKTKSNKIYLIELKERVNKSRLNIKIIDMRRELKNKNKKIFSKDLIKSIEDALSKREQILLFLNRRGFSSFVLCRNCGNIIKCDTCDVNLTLHNCSNSEKLICHYCGKKKNNYKICPLCRSNLIKSFGLGTQKIEEEIKKLFPDEKILRMDTDAVKKKNDYKKIFDDFKNKRANILIGTQMIAKGLDFPDVSVIGVVAADMILNMSSFLSSEITFNLITQVAGRAGRSKTAGKVFIQTYEPENHVLISAQKNDFKDFYEKEIEFRKFMNYPPFSKIFSILFFYKDENYLAKKTNEFKIIILKIIDKFNIKDFRILGPTPCAVSKVKNIFRWSIILKYKNKKIIREVIKKSFSEFNFENIKTNIYSNYVTL
ncbi:MAG: primosomal protein N' [Clostridiales bacterium]|jgi:primosomal protein N' (replication factor Y)|nr:primosomal protein N' [Clostridiales bacterium]